MVYFLTGQSLVVESSFICSSRGVKFQARNKRLPIPRNEEEAAKAECEAYNEACKADEGALSMEELMKM